MSHDPLAGLLRSFNPDSEVELPQRTQGAQREGCRAGPPVKNLAWFGTHQTRCPAVRFFAFFAANFGIRAQPFARSPHQARIRILRCRPLTSHYTHCAPDQNHGNLS